MEELRFSKEDERRTVTQVVMLIACFAGRKGWTLDEYDETLSEVRNYQLVNALKIVDSYFEQFPEINLAQLYGAVIRELLSR